MVRSIFYTLLLIVIASNVAETEGLAAIIRRVRNVGVFGIRRAQRMQNVAPPNVKLVAQAQFDPATAVPPVTASFDSFDIDSYRKEMTELVYQRSLQRLHVN